MFLFVSNKLLTYLNTNDNVVHIKYMFDFLYFNYYFTTLL